MSFLKAFSSGAISALGSVIIVYPSAVALGVAAGTGVWSGIIALVIGTTFLSLVNQHRALIHVPATSLCVAASAVTLNYNVSSMLAATMLMGLMQIGLGLIGTSWVFHMIPRHITNLVISAVGVVLIVGQFVSFNKTLTAHAPDALLDAYLINGSALFAGVVLIFFLQRFKWTNQVSLILAPTLVVATMRVLGVELPSFGVETGQPFSAGSTHVKFMMSEVNWGATITATFSLLFISSMKETVVLQKVRELDPAHAPNANKQMVWLGVANMLASFFGALPLTINTDRTIQTVKSTPNNPFAVSLQGVLILGFVFLMPHFFSSLPLVVLGMLLVYSGIKLIDFEALWNLRKLERSEAAVSLFAFASIIIFDIPVGTMIALGLAFFKLAFTFASDVELSCHEIAPKTFVIKAKGALTFLSIPKLLELSGFIHESSTISLDSRDLYFVDYSSKNFLYDWKRNVEKAGGTFRIGSEFQALERHRPVLQREKIVLDLKSLDRRKGRREERTGRRAVDRYLAELAIDMPVQTRDREKKSS